MPVRCVNGLLLVLQRSCCAGDIQPRQTRLAAGDRPKTTAINSWVQVKKRRSLASEYTQRCCLGSVAGPAKCSCVRNVENGFLTILPVLTPVPQYTLFPTSSTVNVVPNDSEVAQSRHLSPLALKDWNGGKKPSAVISLPHTERVHSSTSAAAPNTTNRLHRRIVAAVGQFKPDAATRKARSQDMSAEIRPPMLGTGTSLLQLNKLCLHGRCVPMRAVSRESARAWEARTPCFLHKPYLLRFALLSAEFLAFFFARGVSSCRRFEFVRPPAAGRTLC